MGTSSPDAGGVETVTVRYWAGARAAAGVDEEVLTGVATVGELVGRLLATRPGLTPVLPVCSVLVGGRASTGEDPVPAGAVVEVLPPFAGG
ncbi:MAG TPA: MoaD/ThiS family protein [Ornithinibacter sp.]|nr:MoaD/ThiS family protein [Ornithinibacter sp.]